MSGRYMDFAPRKRPLNGQAVRKKTVSVVVKEEVAKPVVRRPVEKPKVREKVAPVVKVETKPIVKVEAKPVVKAPEVEVPTVRDALDELETKEKIPVAEVIEEDDFGIRGLSESELREEEDWGDEEEMLGVIEELDEPIEVGAGSSLLKDDRVGFVDGKSPFINTEKLEKRPLSALRRDKPVPKKNSYAERVKAASEKSNVPTMVVTGTSMRSNFSLLIVIILVAALGAVVGFGVYLAFFQ